MELLYWIVGIVVVIGLVYRFWPKGRAKIDQYWDNVDRKDDGRGLR